MSMFKRTKKEDKKQVTDNKPPKMIVAKTPSDVKLTNIMIFMILLAVALISSGMFYAHHNHAVHYQQLLANSMPQGSKLGVISSSQTQPPTLTVGNTILSKDGKDLAVRINYSSDAKTSMSAFGNRYRLRLVTTKQYPMNDVKMTYGLLGTDGSGVLQIHSDHGFKNQAFAVVLMDTSKLLSANAQSALAQSSTDNSTSLDADRSMTAQLSDNGSSNSSSGDSSNSNTDANISSAAPLYYVRLNAKNAHRMTHNFTTNKVVLSDLFLDDAIKTAKQNIKTSQSRLDVVNRGIDDMNERLKENPNDNTAQNALQSLTQTRDTLTVQRDNAVKQEKSYEDARTTTLTKNVLNPQQKSYKRVFMNNLSELDKLSSQASNKASNN